jgi:hypothetical protein
MVLVRCGVMFAGLAWLAAVAGCAGHRDDAPCSAVAARLLVVARAEMDASRAPAELLRQVSPQLPALRDAVDEACARGGWSETVRACMVTAADGAALASCQQGLSAEQRQALDRASASR